jgi:hypothetical protein
MGHELGTRKWSAIVLLMIGCMVSKWGDFTVDSLIAIGMMAIQASMSSLGGVANEFLFKKDVKLDINYQNIWLYLFSIIGLFLSSMVMRLQDGSSIFYWPFDLWNGWIIFAVVIGASGGFTTSLLLKYFNVIVKEYATATEMVIIALFQSFMFDVPLEGRLFVAIGIVSFSSLLYSFNPLKMLSS